MYRLSEFDVVSIALPEEGLLRDAAFKCHVLAVAGSTIALEPLDRVSVTWLPERVVGAFLAFRHQGALIALKGSLLQRGAIGDLRFKVSDPTNASLRPATRVKSCVPVSLRFDELGTTSEGRTVDVSADELHVECDDRAPAEGSVAITISVPNHDEPIELPGTIDRADGNLLALQLSATACDARRRIAMFVLEHNRAALHHRQQLTVNEDVDF